MSARRGPKRTAEWEEIKVPREGMALARTRVSGLLLQYDRPLIDLMANAYLQGLIDCTEAFNAKGAIYPPADQGGR